ncbi:oxidoreductase [Spirochaetia bacterium]|nr:oxidoreductase [Spirochaetia bacterium]
MALKAAIVGLGRIASLLEEDRLREKPCTHAGAITANPGLVLCAGADLDKERRRLFAKRWSVPVYENAETMLREVQPHILHIATHPDSHLLYCSLAARYGVSVAVCEKPLADTLGKAKRIAALHESRKLSVVTNHERRYAADYTLARRLLSEGKIGSLAGVKAVLYMGKTRRLLDVLWHDGTHLADAAMFLTGGVLKHCKTFGAREKSGPWPSWLGGPGPCRNLKAQRGTVYLQAVLEQPTIPVQGGPLPFLMELGAGRDHLVFELEFSGEKGKLLIGNGIFEVWESKESPYAEGFRSLEKTMEGFTGPTGYFSAMAADALACALDKSRAPLSSAVDGLRVIRYLRSVAAW